MTWAALMLQHPEVIDRLTRSRRVLGVGVMLYLLGLVSAFTLWGMAVSPLLLAIGLLVLLYPLLNQPWMTRLDRLGLRWFGDHSYAFFLVHHPLVIVLVRDGLGLSTALFRLGLAIGISIVLTIILERVVDWVSDRPS
jgi:peptidoglycan/LPS O-acetylase OafA/YrhL